MAKNFYVGVDGGGTKCKLRLEDEDGNLLGQSVAGPANVRLSVEGTWDSIFTALEEVLDINHLSLNDPNIVMHAGLGLAGLEVSEACNAFLKKPHPFKTIEIFSDAHAACIGAHHAEDGGIIVVGTGVVGYQVYQGQGSRVGGWGFPHDDEGGGAWLGLQAIKLTFEWLDHRVEKSPLVEDVFECFNRDLDAMIVFANRANASEYARIAPIVINHGQQEEIAAVRLLKKSAHAIEKIHHGLHKIRDDGGNIFPIALFGGIAPFVEPWLNDTVKHSLVQKQADATVGAILLVKQAMQQKVGECQ